MNFISQHIVNIDTHQDRDCDLMRYILSLVIVSYYTESSPVNQGNMHRYTSQSKYPTDIFLLCTLLSFFGNYSYNDAGKKFPVCYVYIHVYVH